MGKFRATPTVSTTLRTDLTEINPKKYILFSITDQGRGIPSDKLESIFGRFQQVNSGDFREKGGTG